EQLGMRRRTAHASKIVRRVDEAATKVKMPDAVDNRSPGQWIVAVREPSGQRGATGAFVVGVGERKARGQRRQTRQRARPGFFAWLGDLTAMQEMNGPRRCGGLEAPIRFEVAATHVDQRRRREPREFGGQLLFEHERGESGALILRALWR